MCQVTSGVALMVIFTFLRPVFGRQLHLSEPQVNVLLSDTQPNSHWHRRELLTVSDLSCLTEPCRRFLLSSCPLVRHILCFTQIAL